MAFPFFPSKGSSNLFSPSPHRYANTRHPAVRYSAYVRQRPPLVLLCLLHLWDCRCAALGRAAQKQMFPRQKFCNVSTAKKSPSFLPFSLSPAGETSADSRVSIQPGCSQGQIQQHRDESAPWPCHTAAMAALNVAVILSHKVVGFRTLNLAGYFFLLKLPTCHQVAEGSHVFPLHLKDKDVSDLDCLCPRKLRSLTPGI